MYPRLALVVVVAAAVAAAVATRTSMGMGTATGLTVPSILKVSPRASAPGERLGLLRPCIPLDLRRSLGLRAERGGDNNNNNNNNNNGRGGQVGGLRLVLVPVAREIGTGTGKWNVNVNEGEKGIGIGNEGTGEVNDCDRPSCRFRRV